MRLPILTSIAAIFWLLAGAPAGADQVTTPSAAGCQIASTLFDRREINCPLAGAKEPKQYRFTARFSGGHDDTRAWITPRLKEAPLQCEPGSKTELEGEEGEISLQCTFSVPASADTKGQFQVQVRWSHCEYMDFTFVEVS